jgi:hypothetical protein
LKYIFRSSKLDPFGIGGGKPIVDYWAVSDPTNSAKQPATGYEPWNIFQLRKVSQSDPKMDARAPQWNAGSYIWFAL